jgi:uncharacterized membrane protein
MAFRLRLGGHPVHPLLVHFPIALWTVAPGADLAGWIYGWEEAWLVSFGSQAVGIVIALLAMVAGFLDFAAIPRDEPAQGVAVSHLLAMSTAWLLFIVSLAMRGLPGTNSPSIWATVTALVAWAVMAFGGWLGGRLVYEFGIGVAGRRRR